MKLILTSETYKCCRYEFQRGRLENETLVPIMRGPLNEDPSNTIEGVFYCPDCGAPTPWAPSPNRDRGYHRYGP